MAVNVNNITHVVTTGEHRTGVAVILECRQWRVNGMLTREEYQGVKVIHCSGHESPAGRTPARLRRHWYCRGANAAP